MLFYRIREAPSQAISAGDVRAATRRRRSCDRRSIYDRKRLAVAPAFPIVHISSWKVDDAPQPHFAAEIEQTVSALGAKVAKARAERGWSLQQLANRAGPLARRDPQDREERHDADHHEPHEGGRRARAQRGLLHRGGRPAAAGDRRAPRRARRGSTPPSRASMLQNVSGRYGPFFAAGAEAFVEPRRRQRPRADGPPRRGARRAARGRDALQRRRRATTTSQEGDSIHFRTAHPHSWRNPSDRPARAIWLAIRSA